MTTEVMSENFGEPAPKAIEVNCETGEQIVRELTADEIAQRALDAQAYAESEAAREADAQAREALKESAKAKLIAGEALTEDEAAVLVI